MALLQRLTVIAITGTLGMFVLTPSALAEPGELDATFSGDGKVTTNFRSGDDWAWDVALQEDGKIVAAGPVAGAGGRFALVRYSPDGTLDTSLSGDGKATTNFHSGWDGATAVAIQPDGKIVTAGRAGGSGGRFGLVRYHTDGTLDTSFSGDGKVTANFTSGDDWASDVGLQADGKIVAAGAAAGSGGRFALVRYHTDGTLDTTFSGDGKATTNFTSGWDAATGVAVQADGKIVAAGEASGSGGRFALARYNTGGSLDATFSGDGKVTTNLTSKWDHAWTVTIQSDGKIVAAGASSGAGGRFSVIRYSIDGSVDTSFGGDGSVITNFTSGDDWAYDVALQADGKIVAAGVAAESGNSFALARYHPDGSLDTSFGKVTTNFTPASDGATAIVIQPDGKTVAAGWAAGGGGDAKFALARYLGD